MGINSLVVKPSRALLLGERVEVHFERLLSLPIPHYIETSPMFDRILVLCTGNICRSPMAEILLRHHLGVAGARTEVQSAGTGALVDHGADTSAVSLMQDRGLDLTAHRARQVTRELTRWADVILVMEGHHRDELSDTDPAARGKAFLLGHWIGQEIPDPYKRGEDEWAVALQLIDEGVASWVGKIALHR